MKMPQTPEEVAQLIMKRDNISYNEALIAVRDCMAEIDVAIDSGRAYESEDILADYLGLEPDYLMALIM